MTDNKIKRYFEGLKETFIDKPWSILSTGILFWLIFPIIIMSIYAILQIAFKPTNPNLDTLVEIFTNAILPWWVGIIINPIKSLLWILAFIILALILVNEDIIEPITFKQLIKSLSSKKQKH